MKQAKYRKFHQERHDMRAKVVSGYDREKRDSAKDYEDYPDEFPFCLIQIIAEPEDGSETRVASYIEISGPSNRESRLFVERSPPGMGWLERVFEMIRNTESLGVMSGGLHEIRINCEDKIEIREESPALIDHCENKVYFDDGNSGNTAALDSWMNEKTD